MMHGHLKLFDDSNIIIGYSVNAYHLINLKQMKNWKQMDVNKVIFV